MKDLLAWHTSLLKNMRKLAEEVTGKEQKNCMLPLLILLNPAKRYHLGIILCPDYSDHYALSLSFRIIMLQVHDKRTTHGLAKTASLIIFWSFYKHALHGWSISTLLSIYYLTLRRGPYQLIALSPCLPHFLSLSMLQ